MEYVIAEQKQLSEKISQLLTNAKKEPLVRRTRDRINKMLENLDELWTTFEQNDDSIRAKLNDLANTYYTDSVYDETKGIHETARQLLNEFLDKISQSEAEKKLHGSKLWNSSENGKLFLIRLERLEKSLNWSDQIEITKANIQYKLNVISKFLDKINEQHEILITKTKDDAEVFELNDILSGITEKTEIVTSRLNELMEKETQIKKNSPKLAPITIPKFDGQFKQWLAFKNIFMKLVHEDKSLSDTEKLQYLQTNVTGEAMKIISHLQLTDNNYEIALQLIENRYDNPRKITEMYIDTILDLSMTSGKSASIKLFHDTLKECIEGLNNVGIQAEESAFITRMCIRKLDFESLKVFEQNLTNPKQLPSLQTLLSFLESRHLLLDTLDDKKKIVNANYINKTSMNEKEVKCDLCKGDHVLRQCKKFEELTVNERNKFVQRKNLCQNCLSHPAKKTCWSKQSCFNCNRKHHTLLHYSNDKMSKQKNFVKEERVLSSHIGYKTTVLLSTALLYIKNSCGRFEPFRALIDPGSQVSLITEDAAALLDIPRLKSNIEVAGVGDIKQQAAKNKINIEIRPHFSQSIELQVMAHVLPKLTGDLPNESILDDKKRWRNITLADPNYDEQGPIDLLLGSDIYPSIILQGVKIGNPTATKTKLGWILNGPTKGVKLTNVVQTHVSTAEINESITRFWNIEEVKTNQEFVEEEEILQKSKISKNRNGKYEVSLPFKNKVVDLGCSRSQALARFFQIERILEANPQKRAQYNEFMKEYLQLGHMKIIEKCVTNEGYYLPHHGVWKNDNITTKLRVVFDASAVTTNGKSLNDELLIGPTLQENLTTILTRWRTHRYVFTADIEKMYRQIDVNKEDQKYQKILWRFSKTEPVQEYKLTTVTYGTASAPYLAIRTLHQLANDEESNKNNRVIQIIKNDFYVDDLISGAECKKSARSIIEKLNSILKNGGFTLRKWTSNDSSLIQDLPKDLQLNSLMEFNKDNVIKTLGIWWNSRSDKFMFKIHIDPVKKWTKRNFLANMSKLFDPMGWLAPITINTKLMMQELWQSELNWDEECSKQFRNRWEKLEKELSLLEHIEIPRNIELSNNGDLEIHGFCDSSEKAYAAVVYAKVNNKYGTYISLLGAKTRVAPLNKEQTIPRLELCGAVLLVNYINEIMKAFKKQNNIPIYYWTDSTITLAWIKGQSQKWKSFVAHRVTEINKLSVKDNWFHVKSQDNPADIASRGINPGQIINNQLWWYGPNWLKENWKLQYHQKNFTTIEEVAKEAKQSKTNIIQSIPDSTNIINRFSSFGRLIRVTAYLRRFKTKNKGMISSQEISETTTFIIKLVQKIGFENEIKLIANNKTYQISHKLLQLHPFLDDNGIMRVGGRLKNLQITTLAKHPIILPSSQHFTKLIVEHAHKQTMHGGNQLTLAFIRQTYWIPNAKCLVRKVIHECIKCHRFRAETAKQIMGNLPLIRINPAPAFTNTGVDYAGPINIRVSKGRGTKSYKGFIAVFVCLVTRAIHLEVVSDMTTEAFQAAFKRFIARRGHCLNIYSDNGTTFVGANKKQLAEFQKYIKLAAEDVLKSVAEVKTTWHFIPPGAPHFGGIWEAAVKSMKYHLKRSIGEQILTFEELSTVLCQIEACLNSRPITPLSNDPSDMLALTPGHFLIGRPINAAPEIDITNLNWSSRWKLLTRIVQSFWKIWSNEYLSRLQQRPKWMKTEHNLKVGDLMLIKEDNLPPTKWSMGRITEIHPGTDGLVRAVTLKGPKNTILKRPITKLCPLPINDSIDPNNTASSTTQLNQKATSHPLRVNTVTEKEIATEEKENSTIELKNPPRNWMRGINIEPLKNQAQQVKNKSIEQKATKRKGPTIRPHIPPKILLIMATICAIMKSPITEAQEQFQIKPFVHQPGIYFEEIGNVRFQRNEWNLIIHYNLKSYKDTIQQVQDSINNLKEACHHLDTMCNAIYLESQHLMFNINTSDVILQNSNKDNQNSHNNRHKRGLINGIGYIANELFGILDARSAAKYEAEINELQINNKHLLRLAQNHTSITDATLRLFSENTEFIKQELQFLNETITNQITRNSYTSIVLKLILTMMRIQELQGKMLDIILDTQHGKFNPILLPPVYLLEELKLIRSHIPANVIIPDIINGNLAELYNMMTVKTRLTENNIIFSIKIPLPDVELHEIFKLIPLPISYKDELLLITPSSEYLIINNHRDHFYPLNGHELRLCYHPADNIKICKPHNPIYNVQRNESRCEVALINHKPDYYQYCTMHIHSKTSRWIQLSKPNSWIYAMDDVYPIDIVCNSRVINSTNIKGQGIIQLNSGCLLKQNGLTIAAHNTIISHIEPNFFPLVNAEKVIKSNGNQEIKGLRISATDIENQIKSLQTLVKQQQASEEKSVWNNHDIHHYTMIYIAAISGIITVTSFVITYRKHLLNIYALIQTLDSSPAANTQAIQLTESAI